MLFAKEKCFATPKKKVIYLSSNIFIDILSILIQCSLIKRMRRKAITFYTREDMDYYEEKTVLAEVQRVQENYYCPLVSRQKTMEKQQ